MGGYTPEKIALRRAIGMAYNVAELIRVFYYGRAVPAQGPIPPDISGFDPNLRTRAQDYDPAAARALLDRFGYKDRDGDGYRERPDGKPLVIERWSVPTSSQRLVDELWKKNSTPSASSSTFATTGCRSCARWRVRARFPSETMAGTPTIRTPRISCSCLYGPNIGQANDARFNLPEFNRLFEQASRLPDSPERTMLFDRMTELVIAYAPWRMTISIVEDSFAHPWVHDFVPHPIKSQTWMYAEVVPARQ